MMDFSDGQSRWKVNEMIFPAHPQQSQCLAGAPLQMAFAWRPNNWDLGGSAS